MQITNILIIVCLTMLYAIDAQSQHAATSKENRHITCSHWIRWMNDFPAKPLGLGG
ncbi:hypothetical protein [Mucilaginibacter endophyticus]|uniref:hypothetical protein n=1 Tax=Mucilaginibacter endophyticus TaxID=2675003 RepID=UPI0012B17E73|nr:hypothetical protein [Mucilaginibacter endophyticus]